MTQVRQTFGRLFAALFGGFLGLSLLKFTTPPVLENMVGWPATGWEWCFNPWPACIGQASLLILSIIGFSNPCKVGRLPLWLLFAPIIWLGWQFISATQSVSGELSRATTLHFACCVLCFLLGVKALPKGEGIYPFLTGLAVGISIVIIVGWQQQFGGLEETQRYFFAYIYPQTPDVSPEYLKKISSNRIFSTLFYPNALAGALLLSLPMLLFLVWDAKRYATTAARATIGATCLIGGLACMVWSGSKGGWVLLLGMAILAAYHLRISRRSKLALISSMLAIGLAGFAARYSNYFQKGATSVGARADYWTAAIRTAQIHPLFGTGPGTFAIPYKELKAPTSEMARLVHNDYLEQAADSGIVGFLSYLVWTIGGLAIAFKKVKQSESQLGFVIWASLMGWFGQGFIDFSLYIPATAWAAFAMLGWLCASGNGFDNKRTRQ